MKTALVNGIVITPNESFLGGVIVEGEEIIEVFSGTLKKDCDQIIDVAGRYIAPGFIDLHLHGGGGADFTYGNKEDYMTAARMHMSNGTTAMMPTITTCPADVLDNSLNAYKQASCEDNMPIFIGAHLEGPYFAPEQAGAQDPESIRCPKKEEYTALLDKHPEIKRWDVAAELDGGLEMGLELRKRGVVASVGHSNALYEDMVKAADYGYTLLTHFYSGMSGVHRINAYRYSGVIESGYLMDDFDVEIIADGSHLPASLLKLIYKSKGSSKICLVTDALNAAGMGEGYKSHLGSVEYFIEDGVGKLMDRSAFCGSVTTANNLVKVMVEKADVSLTEAVKMMTLTPARVAGVDHLMGSLVPGKLANITVFDSDFAVDAVMVKGSMTCNRM